MPNEVTCVISHNHSDHEKIYNFIRTNVAYRSDVFPVEKWSPSVNDQIKYYLRFITAWEPPSPKKLMLNNMIPDSVTFRLAWSEPGVLGYGWWERSEGHTESHVYDDVEISDDDDESGGGVPVGEYKKFLEREGFGV